MIGENPNLMPGCFACDQQEVASPPPREDVLRTEHWRAVHAFNSTLPGWLVLVPTRHMTSFTDTPEAADELGGLVRRLSLALEQVTGCVKTYLMQFSEADGYAHLHLHLVPRLPITPRTREGQQCLDSCPTTRTSGCPQSSVMPSRSPSKTR